MLARKSRSQPTIASETISPVFGRRSFLSSALGGAACLATSVEPRRASPVSCRPERDAGTRSVEAGPHEPARNRLCRSRSARWSSSPAAPRMAIRYPYLCRGGPPIGSSGIWGDRSLLARLWGYALPFGRERAQGQQAALASDAMELIGR